MLGCVLSAGYQCSPHLLAKNANECIFSGCEHVEKGRSGGFTWVCLVKRASRRRPGAMKGLATIKVLHLQSGKHKLIKHSADLSTYSTCTTYGIQVV